MLRSAQLKKNELVKKADDELEMYRAAVLGAGMKESSLIAQKSKYINDRLAYDTAIIADNLLYNIALNEPTPDNPTEDLPDGYVVDYSLKFAERYVVVRNYYMKISNPQERLTLYLADETAKSYLSGYYYTLKEVLQMYAN